MFMLCRYWVLFYSLREEKEIAICPIYLLIGDYVMVESIAEGNKVTAEIVHILYPVQIKHLKEQKLWLVAL